MQILLVTFIAFPGVIIHMDFKIFGQTGPWKQLILVTIHNFSDTSGRVVGGRLMMAERTIFIFSWLRLLQALVFIAITFFFNEYFETEAWDMVKIANLMLFSFGNGYL